MPISKDDKNLAKVFVSFVIFAMFFVFVWFNPLKHDSTETSGRSPVKLVHSKTQTKLSDPTMDTRMTERTIPGKVIELVGGMTEPSAKFRTVEVDNAEYKIAYRQVSIPENVEKSGQTVLLLHGSKFSSKTWAELKTLRYLAAMGHNVVAIDIPGKGESPAKTISKKGNFVKKVIEKFGLEHPVVVSPSMSGSYALPLVMSEPSILSGYVPVAPAGSDDVAEKDLQQLQLPTLIVYGENDKKGAVTSQKLKNIPKSRMYKISEASHPAYLDNPDLWHQLLYNFLIILKDRKW